jgi:hypothetical protein
MPSDRVRRLQLEAEIAAARLREESLQYAWGAAQYTSSSTRSAEAVSVDLLRAQAEIAELEERLAELDGAPPPVPAPAPVNPPEPAPECVGTREAARLLGVSPRTLEGLRMRGAGPAHIRVGKRVLYPLASLRNPTK